MWVLIDGAALEVEGDFPGRGWVVADAFEVFGSEYVDVAACNVGFLFEFVEKGAERAISQWPAVCPYWHQNLVLLDAIQPQPQIPVTRPASPTPSHRLRHCHFSRCTMQEGIKTRPTLSSPPLGRYCWDWIPTAEHGVGRRGGDEKDWVV